MKSVSLIICLALIISIQAAGFSSGGGGSRGSSGFSGGHSSFGGSRGSVGGHSSLGGSRGSFGGSSHSSFRPSTPSYHAPARTGHGHTPVRTAPVHSPVRTSPIHTPVRTSPVHTPVRTNPVHGPIRTPGHTPVKPSPVHTPIRPNPVHTPVKPSPVHTPVKPNPVHTPVKPSPVHTPVKPNPVQTPVKPSPVHTPVKPTPVQTPVKPAPVQTPVKPSPVQTPVKPAPATTGGLSAAQIQKIMPGAKASVVNQYAPYLNQAMKDAGINTPARQNAFLAQLAHESGQFRYMQELASGKAYEGRKDLGNTHPGDGERYKGRGPIQITGRANYEAAGKALGIDLVKHPELAATPEVGFKTAAWFWNHKNLNSLADKNTADSFSKITKAVNGCANCKSTHAEERNKFWRSASEINK